MASLAASAPAVTMDSPANVADPADLAATWRRKPGPFSESPLEGAQAALQTGQKSTLAHVHLRTRIRACRCRSPRLSPLCDATCSRRRWPQPPQPPTAVHLQVRAPVHAPARTHAACWRERELPCTGNHAARARTHARAIRQTRQNTLRGAHTHVHTRNPAYNCFDGGWEWRSA